MSAICYEYGIEMYFSFNAAKCHLGLVHVGKDHKINLLLKLGDNLLSRVNEFKYLGCIIRIGVKLQVAVDIN